MRPALILYFVKLNIVFICCSSLTSVISGKMEQDNLLSLRMLFCGISIFCHPPPSQTIQPRDPDTVNEELDSVLSPINLQGQTGCNCDLQPINLQGQTGCNCDLQPIHSVCLVDITLQYSIVDCEKWTMAQR